MIKRGLATILVLLLLTGNLLDAGQTYIKDRETYLKDKSEDGSILTLGDGSVWQVMAGDEINIILWPLGDRIIITESESELIHAKYGKKVKVTRLK